METIGERIKHVRGQTSQADFSRNLGIHRNTLVRYETGEGFPDSRLISSICEQYGVNPEWLLMGIGRQSGTQAADNDKTPDPDNYYYIPMAEARLSAGGGSFILSEGIRDYYAFRKRFINYIATSHRNLVLMKVSGNSMEPEIKDGGTVMVDMGRTLPKSGCFFAIGFDEVVTVKELEIIPGGRVQIISKNRTEYLPYEADLKDIRIIGQIIWGDRMFPI